MTLPEGNLHVCLVAENASVRMGGEAVLPVHLFRQLRARGVDTRLVVHARCQQELLELFPQDHDRLLFVPDTRLQHMLFRKGQRLPRRVAEVTLGLVNQMLTQRAQRKLVRRMVGAPNKNWVVHQPIPVAPRFPSLLYGLGVPVVVGPLNGGMEWPAAFRTREGRASRAVVALGRSLSNTANRLLPGKLQAAVVLVANDRTRRALPADIRGIVHTLVENGVDLQQWHQQPTTTDTGEFCFVGRLVDWKGLDLLLQALVRVPDATLAVAGDGPMRARWEAEAAALHLSGRVRWLGWQSQQGCAHILASSRALVLPSLFECGGAVVLEAMALGKPVIATRWGGPEDYLQADCGLLVDPTSREALVQGLAAAMQKLLHDPALARRMGQAGRTRVAEHFSWASKTERLLGIYGSLLEN